MTRTYIAALVVTLSVASSAFAVPFTWDSTNATGNWGTNSNWIGGSAPPDDNTANIFIDGGAGPNVTVTLDGTRSIDTLTVSSGDTLEASSSTRTIILQNASTGTFNNAGTLRATGVGTTFQLRGNSGTANVNSGIIEAVSGGIFRFDSGEDNYTINNTGGIIRAQANSSIALRNKDITVSGGTLTLASGATLFGPDVQVRYTFNDVATTNDGTIDWNQIAISGVRTKYLAFGGNGTFTNSSIGVIDLLQQTDLTGFGAINDFRVEGTQTFNNQGLINIINEGTAGFTIGLEHRAVFSVAGTAAANFSNTGTINITHDASTHVNHPAQFVAGGNITNAGTFNVDGVSASIEMGANTFLQTAGRLELANDATVNAGLVNIAGGELAGTGTINGNLNLDDTLNMQIGTTNDLLTVNGSIVLNSATSILDLDQIGSFTGPIDLVQFSGTLTGTFSSVIGLPDFYQVAYGSSAISLVEFVPAPEPSSLCLLGLGFVVVLKRSRMRRRV